MKLLAFFLLVITLLDNNPDRYKPSEKPGIDDGSVNDTTFSSLKNIDVQFMLRGYFYALSSIEDKDAPGGYGGSDNKAKEIFQNKRLESILGLKLFIDTTSHIVFAEKFKGQKVYLINQSGMDTAFEASDSRLSIVAEAFYKGSWRSIEYLPSSWCGNSYHKVYLKNNEYWEFNAPRYLGLIKVRLRYRLNTGQGNILYSNEVTAFINKKQFSVKQGHSPNGIMDPYND
jgi:hypothetical protein